MTIVFGADHRGSAHRDALIATLGEIGSVVDVAELAPPPGDYVEVSQRVVARVAAEGGYGVIICGTGVGISIVANKHGGISAARCVSVEDAIDCRLVNNSNVLCLSAKTPIESNQEIIKAFFATKFPGDEKRTQRLTKIAELERRNFK